MCRYINADRFLFELSQLPGDVFLEKQILDLVDKIPTADVQGVRHGKWQMKPLFNSQLDKSDVAVRIRCSGCGMKLIAQKCGPFPNYCANCGSKNDSERGNDVQK